MLAPMPLNVGLNYVKEKSSGCLPSLLRHGGKYKDILLRSHQLLSLTSPVPYIDSFPPKLHDTLLFFSFSLLFPLAHLSLDILVFKFPGISTFGQSS